LGGTLTVEYDKTDDTHFENIWLCGPAEKVFEGTLEVK
jgi:diaminopimelate epimerase